MDDRKQAVVISARADSRGTVPVPMGAQTTNAASGSFRDRQRGFRSWGEPHHPPLIVPSTEAVEDAGCAARLMRSGT
ncbi:MAG TPA: hypothetical protein VMG58_15880, partial [Candidatus Sulfotelmatobacter sp.]|nr:hypothetical protein [Candidatus Sulfotelmatobacter sp.]